MSTVADIGRLEITLHMGAEPDYHGHGGQAVYGLALDMLRSCDPQTARDVHDGSGPKPISASPITPTPEGCRFSLGALTSQCAAGLLAAFAEAHTTGRVVRLTGAAATVAAVRVVTASYSDLLDRAARGRHIELNFLSPTLFRRSGASLVLPEPELVFGSLLRTWNAFSHLQLPPYEPVDLSTLMISRHRIHTQMVDFGAYRLLGFVGQVRYMIPPDTPAQFRQVLNCLADYACFSGVGYRTTMGMGVCQRMQ